MTFNKIIEEDEEKWKHEPSVPFLKAINDNINQLRLEQIKLLEQLVERLEETNELLKETKRGND